MKKLLLFNLLLLFFGSCVDSHDLTEEYEVIRKIDISVKDFIWEDQTRITADISEGNLVFNWTDEDTISIYPDVGSQVEFITKASQNSVTTATFDGGAWALKSGHSFTAFYPYSFYNRKADNILLDYSGQCQTVNNNLSEACSKDYIFTAATKVMGESVDFEFEHLGAYLYLVLSMPNTGDFISVSLCSKDDIFPIKQKLDLTSGYPVLTNLSTNNKFTVNLQNITINSPEDQLGVAMFLPECDFTKQSVYVVVEDSEGKKYCSSEPFAKEELKQGCAYKRTFSMLKEGELGYIDPNYYEIRLLSIGNSFSIDALVYTPFILQELLPNADIHMGIAYCGGTSLSDHANFSEGGKGKYTFYHYSKLTQKWEEESFTYGRCLNYDIWDYVTYQQVSSLSNDYTSYQPHLFNLLNSLKMKYPTSQPIWMLIHSYIQTDTEDYRSDSLYAQIAEAAQTVLDDTEINIVFPYGTAIQNARHTKLDSLGKQKHLSYDGLHLQSGLPRLVACYTTAQAILNQYKIKHTIMSSKLIITDSLQNSIIRSQAKGTCPSVTTEDYQIAKQCAMDAIEHPFEITTLSE